jgi:hypothetical protein
MVRNSHTVLFLALVGVASLFSSFESYVYSRGSTFCGDLVDGMKRMDVVFYFVLLRSHMLQSDGPVQGCYSGRLAIFARCVDREQRERRR